MQYTQKELAKESKVALTWHGEPTLVRLEPNAEKAEVETGETVEVSQDQAKALLRYSPQWTLKGDKPVKQPYQEKQERLQAEQLKNQAKNAKKEGDKDSDKEPEADVSKMNKDEIKAKLKELGVSFNASKGVEELRALLQETLENAPSDNKSDDAASAS